MTNHDDEFDDDGVDEEFDLEDGLRIAAYRMAVVASMPRLAHVETLEDAGKLLGTLNVPGEAERAWLTSGLAFTAGEWIRAAAYKRRHDALPWWARWRKITLDDTSFHPELTSEARPGPIAAVQAVSAYACRRREDAQALLKPWCEGKRLEKDYVDMLSALLAHMRSAHQELVEAGVHA